MVRVTVARSRWLSALLVVGLLAGLWLMLSNIGGVASGFINRGGLESLAGLATGSAMEVAQAQTTTPTVNAVGKIELMSVRPVVLLTGGLVEQVAVEVGDEVNTGDLLLALDTSDLEDAVRNAQIGLEQAKIGLRAVTESVDASAIAVAEANLLVAQETLALVEAGPTKEELEAARSSAAAAWAAYTILDNLPDPAQLTQADSSLKLAEIDLTEAQRAYDEVKWMPEAGMMPQGAALQRATIGYEAAKASYAVASKKATSADLQAALANAQSAQNALNQLQKRPTSADLASAKAAVTSAQAAVNKLKSSSIAGDIRSAELAVEQAEMGLEVARRNLANARLKAPIAGTVLEVSLRVGDGASGGSPVVTLADMSKLQLVVNVEQKDLPRVSLGQKVKVSVYGFGDKTFDGEVTRIAPQGGSASGPVTFPVTIKLADGSISGLLPGMAATAVFEEK